MKSDEKKLLKLILKNDQDIKRENMNFVRLAKEANMTLEEVYKIVTILLTKKYVNQQPLSKEEFAKLPAGDQVGTISWKFSNLDISEKGLNALDTNWYQIIQTVGIATAIIISIVALSYNP